MGTAEKCCYCQMVLDSIQNKTTLIEDKHRVCIDCYHKVFNIIFKGQFTYDEGLNALYTRLKYDEALKEYLLKSKKLGMANNMLAKDILQVLIKMESEVIKIMYHSERQPVLQDIKKHYSVIDYILRFDYFTGYFTYLDISNQVVSSSNIDYNTRLLDSMYDTLTKSLVTEV